MKLTTANIMPGTLTFDDIEEIWKSGERRGEEVEASRQQNVFESGFCWGFACCVAFQVAALLVRAAIHFFAGT